MKFTIAALTSAVLAGLAAAAPAEVSGSSLNAKRGLSVTFDACRSSRVPGWSCKGPHATGDDCRPDPTNGEGRLTLYCAGDGDGWYDWYPPDPALNSHDPTPVFKSGGDGNPVGQCRWAEDANRVICA